MREQLTPPPNTEGAFVAKPPFKLSGEVMYTLESVRGFAELERAKLKVYERYYQPVGLSESDYLEDAQNNASILFLRTKDGELAYIPNTYLASYPGQASETYVRNVVVADLALVPSYVETDAMVEEIQEVIKRRLGIDSTVSITTLEYEGVITEEEHIRMENLRKENLKGFVSQEEQIDNLKKEVAGLYDQNEELIKLVEAKK